MKVTPSAERHGVDPADALHAWRNAVFVREVEWEGQAQVLAIGPARDGRLLELIAVPPWGATRIIHCMALRPKFRRFLKGDS